MKSVAMRSASEAFDTAIPEPPLSRRLVPHRPLVKTLAGETRARTELEDFVVVEPRALLDGVRVRCGPRAAAKQVGITMHASARPACVQLHAFSMAVCELVDNAIDASKRDQDVVVLVTETVDGDLLWQVQDDGIGMSELEIQAIGEPLPGDAIWFGIVRARAVVENHGGLIHFESTPTFGTTASIWLPRMGRAPTSTRKPPALDARDDQDFMLDSVRPEPSSRQPAARARVLVVDDDPLLRQSFAGILRSYDVTLASNGEEALTLLLTRDFDAIVCDLMMPVMNGMRLFDAVQQRAPHQAARICFITGGGTATESFLASVANPRLYKPFTGASLLEVVGELATVTHRGA